MYKSLKKILMWLTFADLYLSQSNWVDCFPVELCLLLNVDTGKATTSIQITRHSKTDNQILHSYLLHSISSGQATPNISMSLWHSSLALWQMDRHGMDIRPYSVHTGAYRAHRNILKSALHTRFTIGWKGFGKKRTRKKKIWIIIWTTDAQRYKSKALVKYHSMCIFATNTFYTAPFSGK